MLIIIAKTVENSAAATVKIIIAKSSPIISSKNKDKQRKFKLIDNNIISKEINIEIMYFRLIIIPIKPM